MIIECPACNTRYDIKAQLPPEGRTVRCAKCNTVWRAKPALEEELPETAAAAPEVPAEAGSAQPAGDGGSPWNREAASFGAAARTEEEDFSAPADTDAPPSFLSGTRKSGQGLPFEPAGEERPAWQDEEAGQEQGAGKVRWFGSFLRRNNNRPGQGTGAGAGTGGPQSAETIPFPRPAPEPQPGGESIRSLDEARAAVRNVFASLADQRPAGRMFQPQAGAQPGEPAGGEGFAPHREPAAAGRWNYGGTGDGEASGTEGPAWESETGEGFAYARGAGQEPEPEPDANSGTAWSYNAGEAAEEPSQAPAPDWLRGLQAEPRETSDADSQLRNVLKAHFGEWQAPSGDAGAQSQADMGDGEDEGAEPYAGGYTIPWRQPAMPEAEPEERPAVVEDEPGELAGAEPVFDPRLFREIEQTQEHAGQLRQRERRGGLALAAAWGLFLSLAAGLVGGVLAFRDIAAEALPGLAPFYRTIGLPVTVQPLIFEGIQYDWKLTEGKPTLVVRGAVYNRGHRKVKVPDFVVTIKDTDPALDREYSANLRTGGSKIRPDQRAEFQIELLSPSQSIAAVELELRNVR